jgi:VanZ family protein
MPHFSFSRPALPPKPSSSRLASWGRSRLLFKAATKPAIIRQVYGNADPRSSPCPKSHMTTRIRYWLPAIGVAIVISLFSTHYFSAEQTGRVILPILRRIFPSASIHTLRLMHFGIRKLAHITEFGVFSVTIYHGIRGPRSGWKLNWAIITLLIAAAYAGLDEWHQSFVPLREPSLRDVLIDTTGALLAQVLVWAYAKLHINPRDTASRPEQLTE